ncbi:hypothetical protein [uncultured Thiodictyon sp.]|uniref:hypothetical protein n=1 Tax=uncultured Thiodictyon sp. TaxID=1846217 RepID=UPI0025EC2461|nr:hypothetical protein [uncultured Thiodictyon sp.]
MPCTMMNPRLFALGAGALAATLGLPLAAGEGEVAVYECHQGGKVIFSGAPCTDPGGDPVLDPWPARQRRLEVEYSRPDAVQAQQAQQSAAAMEYQAGTVAEADLLDTEILNLETRIANLETERDVQVSALNGQLAQGAGPNETAASWAAGLNQQIISVTNNFNDTILGERTRLGELQARRASLGPAAPPSP